MKISIIVLTAASTLGFFSDLAAQDVDPLESDPLPESSTTESLYPGESETDILIPESSETDPLTDLEVPSYEELPSYENIPGYEEIPMPEQETLKVPESKLGKELENKIRLFEARTKASVDPQLQAELRRAQQVKTFPERRQAMFNYYMGLYGKMLRMEPDLKELIIRERQAELQTLRQTQIRPSTWPVPPPDFPVVETREHSRESSP